MATTTPTRRRRGRTTEARLEFEDRLVLLQWVLSLFEVASFDELAEMLKEPWLEGFDEDNVSRLHRELAHRLFQREKLPADVLLGYDQNIVRHWRAVTERRGQADDLCVEILTMRTAGRPSVTSRKNSASLKIFLY